MDDSLNIDGIAPHRVPSGVDPRRYYTQFAENSKWLFIDDASAEQLEILRVLTKEQGQV